MEVIKRIISYPLSILFYLSFGLTLAFFHPLQWLGVKIGGKKAHRGIVNIMNLCLLRCLYVLGTTFSFKNKYNIPKNRSLILVSNHQSMMDIPMISWYLRKHKPKFISKIELGKGIPSISFNLKYGENVLIDRKNPKQALPALSTFGKLVASKNYAAVIFPEGTRSRNGVPKEFATTGLKILFKNMPEALIVPVTINNSWKLLRFGKFPMGIGDHLSLEIREPIDVKGTPTEELIDIIQKRVISGIKH